VSLDYKALSKKTSNSVNCQMVWLSSPEAVFLKGRFVWANWDIDELKAKAEEFKNNPSLLTTGLLGWP
jgi:hypothetical protein